MAKIFELRGKRRAHYANGYDYPFYFDSNGSGSFPLEETCAAAWVNPETCTKDVLNLTGVVDGEINYHPYKNMPDTNKVSMRWAIIPNWTGAPTGQVPLYLSNPRADLTGGSQFNGIITIYPCGCNAIFNTALRSCNTTFLSTLYPSAVFSFTSGQLTEIMWTYDGDDRTVSISQDGVQLYQATFGTAQCPWSSIKMAGFGFGWYTSSAYSNFKLVNFEIWNTVENHVYTARTGYDSTPINRLSDFNPTSNPCLCLNNTVSLYGNIYDQKGNAESCVVVKVRPYIKGQLAGDVFVNYKYETVGTTNADGFFSGNVMLLNSGGLTEIKIGAQSYSTTIATDAVSINLNTLTLTPVLG